MGGGECKALEQMGFKALATTSAGFALTLSRADNGVTLDDMLAHLRLVANAVTVPVNADFEGAFAAEPDQVPTNVKLATATGVAGLSVEDSTGDEANPLYDFDMAVERVKAARRAIDERPRRRAHVPAHRRRTGGGGARERGSDRGRRWHLGRDRFLVLGSSIQRCLREVHPSDLHAWHLSHAWLIHPPMVGTVIVTS